MQPCSVQQGFIPILRAWNLDEVLLLCCDQSPPCHLATALQVHEISHSIQRYMKNSQSSLAPYVFVRFCGVVLGAEWLVHTLRLRLFGILQSTNRNLGYLLRQGQERTKIPRPPKHALSFAYRLESPFSWVQRRHRNTRAPFCADSVSKGFTTQHIPYTFPGSAPSH